MILIHGQEESPSTCWSSSRMQCSWTEPEGKRGKINNQRLSKERHLTTLICKSPLEGTWVCVISYDGSFYFLPIDWSSFLPSHNHRKESRTDHPSCLQKDPCLWGKKESGKDIWWHSINCPARVFRCSLHFFYFQLRRDSRFLLSCFSLTSLSPSSCRDSFSHHHRRRLFIIVFIISFL